MTDSDTLHRGQTTCATCPHEDMNFPKWPTILHSIMSNNTETCSLNMAKCFGISCHETSTFSNMSRRSKSPCALLSSPGRLGRGAFPAAQLRSDSEGLPTEVPQEIVQGRSSVLVGPRFGPRPGAPSSSNLHGPNLQFHLGGVGNLGTPRMVGFLSINGQ